MELYLRGCSAAMIGLILTLIVGHSRKDFGILISIAVCSMLVICAASYLKPVIGYLDKLRMMGNLDSEVIEILIKAVGIGFLTEISVLICNDAGNASMGKVLQFMGSSVILWLSIPLFQMLTELLQRMMGKL